MNNTIFDILALAALAPSSHNTQPWRVQLDKNKLLVGYDPARQLKIGDPNKRELFISLGCFIETLSLAANEFGYETNYTFLGTSSGSIAQVRLQKAKTTKQGWEMLIKTRRSDRRYYEPKPIAKETLEMLRRKKKGNANLIVFEKPTDINFLADMTKVATQEIMEQQDFRDELATWVRNNWTKKPDGMPGYTQGMPGPISLLAKFVIKKIKKVASDQAKKDSKRIKHSSAVGLICVSEEDPKAWIEAGKLYQLACLSALDEGVKTSAVSAAVILPSTAKQITKLLKLPKKPVALVRFGYTKTTPKAAPRQQIKDFSNV